MSANTVLLLPHQERFVQSPNLFPEIRWHFLLGGYGCGKTRSLAISTLKIIEEMDGDKDEGGLYTKIIVAGYTYAHLEQTFLIDFRAYLDNSKTPYHEDTKNHIFTVGTVQVVLVQLLEPGKIFGQSVYCALCDEVDELPEDTMIEAMKSISQRVRQIVPNHRSPYIMSASTAQGMKGFYRLYCHYKKSGIGFVLTRARTQDNWYLPKEYILDLWKNFTETERKVYMEGQFLSVTQGRVIPGFDWDRNFEPESDMDLELMPGERVYVGQDFNCGIGSTLVITSHGEVQLKDIKVGDYVLTRKGFKKVLTTACRGVKIVYDFGKLGFTKDHVAITPQGDKQLWEAQNFYCLKEQSISEYRKLGTMWETLNELKQYFMMDTCGEDVPTVPTMCSENILQVTRQLCTGTSIKSFMGKYLKGITSITRIDTMITDLKLLSACQAQNMQNFITICQETISENLRGKTQQKRYLLGISQKKVKRTIQKYLRKLGLQERSTVNVLASIVAEYLWLKSERLNAALSAGLNIVSREKLTAIDVVRSEITETLMLLLKELVLFAERRLQELLQRNTVKNISVIGSVPATNEREAEVYDIEVEDAHEFFANGILVHNCGYNRGSAWVVRGDVLHCIKYYDFPQTDDMPNVYRYDFPEQDIFWLPDVTIHEQYPHFARALRKNDIHIIHRSKSPLVEDSCFLISKLCLQGRIKIHSQAREVAEAFSTASRDKDNKIPKGVGPNSPIHAIDGARYVCSYLALVLPEFKDVRKGIMSHLASFRAGAQEMEERTAARLGAGYSRLEGSDFTR